MKLSPSYMKSGMLFAVIAAALPVLGGEPKPAGRPDPGKLSTQPMAPIAPQVQQMAAAGGQPSCWVVLRAQADLSPAFRLWDWKARGQFVHKQLTSVAEKTQPGLRSFLQSRGVDFKPVWIINAIHVTADAATLNEIAARPEVKEIIATRVYSVPQPIAGAPQAGVGSVTWGLDRIRAPQVWSGFGVHGEGIVVCNIDTGVQYDHPALVNQYRGNVGGGMFDHNYNWYDPSSVCGSPSTAPCDNYGHGTHTMGTMVGDDGAGNQIGVAPGARWIAAKGCESNSCSDYALTACAQWILAPTDLNGLNPRPDLRPNIVNNSWGGGGGNTWYQTLVQQWVAAGIFPAFSIGNAGPECGTAGSPGDYPESYASGAFDVSDQIAYFSSRGPSAFGEIKPNIAAPGVDVISSVPGSAYAYYSGTSMASPHTAGSVALLWAAAPTLVGDIPSTIALLNLTAVDTSDLTCGGLPANNNIWGEGKLDVFAAVEQAPRGPTGALQGTITDNGSGLPLAGVQVQAVGPMNRSMVTGPDGIYSFPVLAVGNYNVTASKFGYVSQTVGSVAVNDGATTTQDIALQSVPMYSLAGTVKDSAGQAVAGATVTLLGTPIPAATTASDGAYSFAAVPGGEYDVEAAASGHCVDPQTRHLSLNANTAGFDFSLPIHPDAFGYYCSVVAPAYIEVANDTGLSGDDNYAGLALPFPFAFYGRTYGTVFVGCNGLLSFSDAGVWAYSNTMIPDAGTPNAAIYPYWDDLFIEPAAGGSVRTQVLGTAPNRQFVIEWRNAMRYVDHYYSIFDKRWDMEVILHEDGRILTQYRNMQGETIYRGESATIGIEDEAGAVALQFGFNEVAIPGPDFAVLYQLPPMAFVQGTVTDANDGLPIAGASVQIATGYGVLRWLTTDGSGFYTTQVPLGTYTVQAGASNYSAESAPLAASVQGQVYTLDFVLQTARAEVDPGALTIVVAPGGTATKTLTLRNTGGLALDWQISDSGGSKIALAGAGKTQAAQRAAASKLDPNAFTTGDGANRVMGGAVPAATGDILKAWPVSYTYLPWGVGYIGDIGQYVLISDPASGWPYNDNVFTVDGDYLGTYFSDWADAWAADLAYDASRFLMYQVNVGGNNGIYAWDLNGGAAVAAITDPDGIWTSTSQRGVAYRPDNDTLYVGGWNQGVIWQIKGLSWDIPGEILTGFYPFGGDGYELSISGLAWDATQGVLWEASNSPNDMVYQLDPTTGQVLKMVAHPTPFYNGAGLECNESGNLWMVSQNYGYAFLVDGGADLGWLTENPTSGNIPAGGSQDIQVTVDASGLQAGVYTATITLRSNSGRESRLNIPVTVQLYTAALNAGGPAYTDTTGYLWAADKAYAAPGWGYVGMSSVSVATASPIAGTDDDPLYQKMRRGQFEYKFDVPVTGTYSVELRFAEIEGQTAGRRKFDVFLESTKVLAAHDVAAEQGLNKADTHVFNARVVDGQLNITFGVWRNMKPPVISAIRVDLLSN